MMVQDSGSRSTLPQTLIVTSLLLCVATTPRAGTNVWTATTPYLAGENVLIAGVGFKGVTGTVTTHVYQDTNGDGGQNLGEPDLVGVTVNVTDSQGGMQAMLTNAFGDANFDVPAGVATSDVDDTTLPPGSVLTTGNDPRQSNVPAGGFVLTSVGYQPFPDISVIPPALSFSAQVTSDGASDSKSVTITNDGSAILNISSVILVGADAADFSISFDSGETSLAPVASRTVLVNFDPRSVGAKVANLRIFSDDPDEAIFDLSISGEGVLQGIFQDGFEISVKLVQVD